MKIGFLAAKSFGGWIQPRPERDGRPYLSGGALRFASHGGQAKVLHQLANILIGKPDQKPLVHDGLVVYFAVS